VLKSFIKWLRPALTATPLRSVDDPSFIDVKRLIAELSDDELMHSADAYFAKMTTASEQCWKPFSNPSDAVHITRHLGLVLEAAELFHGARVLDFGCATGWLSLGIAQAGCHVTGIDVSPKALQLAEAMKAARGSLRRGSAEFQVYDGIRLPLADESIDRIVCFDAFHHVRDQRHTLREFARVLRKGGRAAFMEPGPNHSRTPLSQAEMANHKVIENDVSMEDIAQHAAEAGLEAPQMLVQFQRPFTVPVADFNKWARSGIPLARAAIFKSTLERQLTDGQCFFVMKGQGFDDSRRAGGLAAQIVLRHVRRLASAGRDAVHVEFQLRNTGRRHWVTERGPGQVNVGVQVLSDEGRLLDDNHGRIALPKGTYAPGDEVPVQGTVLLPRELHGALRFDVVAELVAWFSDVGPTKPVVLALADLPARDAGAS
jgi:ubiquinone/menaquinone biosynthesis C-methylase UbiE